MFQMQGAAKENASPLSLLYHSSPSPVLLPCLVLFFPFPFFSPYSYPLNPTRGLEEHCNLPQQVWAEPGRQTLLVHFQDEISAPFVTCVMTHL